MANGGDGSGAVRPAPLAFAPSAATTTTAAAPLTVVCVKWGTLYGAEYVNKLSGMVRRALGSSQRL